MSPPSSLSLSDQPIAASAAIKRCNESEYKQWALFTHTIWYVLRNEARETELRALKAQLGLPTKAPAPVMG